MTSRWSGARARRRLFLLDSALISLAPAIGIQGDRLRDTVTGDSFEVNEIGRAVLEALSAGAILAELTAVIAKQFAVRPETVRSDVHDFVAVLHSAGLVSIEQSLRSEALARIGQVRTNLVASALFRTPLATCEFPNRRYSARPALITLACVEAHQPTLFIGLGVAAAAVIFSYSRHRSYASPALILGVLLTLAFFAGIVVSAILHELGHYCMARCLGVRVRSVFLRMFVVGLSFERPEAGKAALVWAAGPLVPITVLAMVLLVTWKASVGTFPLRLTLSYVWLAIAAQHVVSLTPLTDEGRQLAAAIAKLSLRWFTIWKSGPSMQVDEPRPSRRNTTQR